MECCRVDDASSECTVTGFCPGWVDPNVNWLYIRVDPPQPGGTWTLQGLFQWLGGQSDASITWWWSCWKSARAPTVEVNISAAYTGLKWYKSWGYKFCWPDSNNTALNSDNLTTWMPGSLDASSAYRFLNHYDWNEMLWCSILCAVYCMRHCEAAISACYCFVGGNSAGTCSSHRRIRWYFVCYFQWYSNQNFDLSEDRRSHDDCCRCQSWLCRRYVVNCDIKYLFFSDN